MNDTEKVRLRRAVLRYLENRVGSDSAVSGRKMTNFFRVSGFHVIDRDPLQREIRRQIGVLRSQGVLICAKSGAGYYMAEEREEVQEFIEDELEPRIRSLAAVKRAMQEAATQQFGRQEKLL